MSVPLLEKAKRKKAVIGGSTQAYMSWLKGTGTRSRDVWRVRHRDDLMGLELKEDDIVRLGPISADMEDLLRTRIR